MNQLEISKCLKISEANYTVNLYHTTCKVLVNGKGRLEFLNKDLCRIQQLMPENSEAEKLNTCIKQALLQLQENKQTVAECTKCKKACQTRAVVCFAKNHWVHFRCDQLTQKEIEAIENKPNNLYMCKSCTHQLEKGGNLPELESHAAFPDLQTNTGDRQIITTSAPDMHAVDTTASDTSDQPSESYTDDTVVDKTPDEQPQKHGQDEEQPKAYGKMTTTADNTSDQPSESNTDDTLMDKTSDQQPLKKHGLEKQQPSKQTATNCTAKPLDTNPNENPPQASALGKAPCDTPLKPLPISTQTNIPIEAMKMLESHIIELKMSVQKIETNSTARVSTNVASTQTECAQTIQSSTAAYVTATQTNAAATQTETPVNTTRSTATTNVAATQTEASVDMRHTQTDNNYINKANIDYLLAKLMTLEEKVNQLERQMETKTEENLTLHKLLQTKEDKSYAHVAKTPSEFSESTRMPSPPDTQRDIWFKGKDDPLSNLFSCKIKVFDRWYASGEQAYQHRKAEYMNDKEAARDIMLTNNSKEVQQRGNSIKTSQEWRQDREKIMLTILEAKHKFCDAYKQRLTDSTTLPIHEDSHHKYWGGRGGEDKLGVLHMSVRSKYTATRQSSTQISASQDQRTTKTTRVDNTKALLHSHSTTPKRTATPALQSSQHNHGQHESFYNHSDVLLLGDSNTRHLDPAKMTRRCDYTLKQAMTYQEAQNTLNMIKPNQQIVVLHTGTNNLKHESAPSVANQLIHTAKQLILNNNKVVMSKLLPREGILNEKVEETNRIIENELQGNTEVKFTNTDNFYFYDDPNKHMYSTEYRNGQRLPLLHVNARGLAELSRQIQYGIKKLL